MENFVVSREWSSAISTVAVGVNRIKINVVFPMAGSRAENNL
jgi:hypothetical protein